MYGKMRKKQYKCITIHKDVYDEISKLAEICQCSKAHMVEKLATPVFEVASIYENCSIESYALLTKGSIYFQIYNGQNPRMSFGKLTQPLESA
jgi:ferritin-like protein